MWLTVTRLLFGKSIVEYVRDRRAVNSELGPVSAPMGWLISGEEDTPKPHKDDLPDEVGAQWLRGRGTSRALRGLSNSYRRQPIRAEVADED